MKVIFYKSFLQDLKKLKDKKLKEKVKSFILKVENAATLEEVPNIKKLKGYSIAYRAKIQEYRLGMYKEDDTVEMVRFVKGNDIYKLFP